jgi:hypothetical protein
MGTQEWFWKENLNNDIHQHQQNEQTSIASTHLTLYGQLCLFSFVLVSYMYNYVYFVLRLLIQKPTYSAFFSRSQLTTNIRRPRYCTPCLCYHLFWQAQKCGWIKSFNGISMHSLMIESSMTIQIKTINGQKNPHRFRTTRIYHTLSHK